MDTFHVRFQTVLLLMLSIISAITACPNEQQCQCRTPGPILYCKNKGLSEVPEFGDTTFEFTEVTLADNSISTLPANAFKTTGGEGLHTVTLDLTENRITSIHANAFAGLEDHLEVLKLDVSSMTTFPTSAIGRLTNLKELYLKGFSIESLPSDALSGLTSLEILSFDSCSLESLTSSDFSSQRTTLKELYLEKNQFTSVPKQALSSLNELTVLDLGGNTIETIADDDFSDMASLEWLDLSQNGVRTIRTNAFRGVGDTLLVLYLSRNGGSLTHNDLNPIKVLTNLNELDVSRNAIEQIPSGLFQSLNQLQNLDLKENSITAITANDFSGLAGSLRILNLAGNELQSIEQFTFQGFNSLEELSLNGNELLSPFNQNTFSGLNNLKILRLMSVQFTTNDFRSISSLTSLETLNLEENSITSVPDYTFENLISLKSLDLAENSIVTLTQRSLTGLQNSLESIWLDNNDIETLPSCLFFGFTTLDYLGLNDNPLQCDCDAYWLRLRIENMDDFEQSLNKWQCASPDQHAGVKLKDIALEDLCDPPPPTEECEQATTTTTTTSSTTTPTTATVPSTPMEVEVRDISAHKMKIGWIVHSNAELITRFTLECREAETDKIHTQNKEYGPVIRDAMLEDLSASTDYVVCVTSWIDNNGESTCTDATTMPGSDSVQSGFSTTLQIILGCVLAGVVFLILLAVAIVIICIWRKRKRYPPVHKSTTSLNSTVPMVGDQSKRFSKPKPYSISTDMQGCTSIEMERKLEGFTPEERDRILQLFSNTGASTLSMMSTASMRYVPDPSGERGGAYSNQIPLQDEGQYEELPEDQYNYIEYNDINPEVANAEPGSRPQSYRPQSYHPDSSV